MDLQEHHNNQVHPEEKEEKEEKNILLQLQENKSLCEIFRFLFEHDLCIRCILRVCKCSIPSEYCQPSSFLALLQRVDSELGSSLEENYDGALLKIESSQKSCLSCMGILQSCEKHLPQITDYLAQENFDFSSFRLTLKVPLCCHLRFKAVVGQAEQALWHRLGGEETFTRRLVQWREEPIDLKQVYKWVVGGLLEGVLGVAVEAESAFSLNLEYSQQHEMDRLFQLFTQEIHRFQTARIADKTEKKRKVNKHYNPPKVVIQQSHVNVDHVLSLSSEDFLALSGPMMGDFLPPTFSLEAEHANLMVLGRYTKFSRTVSQTKWIVDGKRLYPTSIEEEMAQALQEHFRTQDYVFHSGGREDTDVRMLNGGRPFVMEMVNPRRTRHVSDLKEVEQQINQASHLIQVQGLSLGDVSCFKSLKEAEDQKVKAYSCIVKADRVLDATALDGLSAVSDLPIAQVTPLRVTHRRALMTRHKVIHRLKAIRLNSHFCVVFVLSSAGTYIKEFVHGDLSRTLPNLGTLLSNKCDILQLDVLHLYDQISPASLEHFESLCRLAVPPR